MRESRLQCEIICAEVCTTSPFIWRSLWRRRGSPRLEDPVDDGAERNECTNTKEDREYIFIYPLIGVQVGVVRTIYYPRGGIHLFLLDLMIKRIMVVRTTNT